MLDLADDATRRDPYPAYERLRARSPVLHDPATGLWLVFGYDDVKRVLSDHDAFSSAAAPPASRTARWFVFLDPPEHAKLRALVTRAFTPRSVAALEPRIRAVSRELLERATARGEFDLVADYATPLPLRVIVEMLGAPAEDLPRYRRWSDAMVALSYALGGGEEAARAEHAYAAADREMAAYLAVLVEARRSTPQNDLLTRLVEAEVDGERLGGDDLLAFFQLLLVAGHETTTNVISNAVLCLLEHPAELARLRASPALLPSALEEVLRYRSPVQAMFRVTRRDVELAGRAVPGGKLVLPLIGSANRDPRHFRAASRFDIGRDPNPHLAFGHGIHFCLGASLSRLEARVALADLLERLPPFALASDAPWEPRRAVHVHGPARLPLRLGTRTAGPL